MLRDHVEHTFPTVNRQSWLLLFLGYEGAPEGLDPVRVQKGMFLFAQEADVRAMERYDFVAYNYGPMSKAIYNDLEALVTQDLAVADTVPGAKFNRYTLTPAGQQAARAVAAQADPEPARKLFDIKRHVSRLTFDDLLEDVYERYPDYAANSIFRRYKRRP